MSKRSFNLQSLEAKKAKLDKQTASTGGRSRHSNPFLRDPVQPEKALQIFLTQVRNAARRFLPNEQKQSQITKPFCEVEARLGILKVPHAIPDRRVLSSGTKRDAEGRIIRAFDCSTRQQQMPRCLMASGTSRTHFSKCAGISEVSALSQALGVTSSSGDLKRDLVETQMVETVYTGYPDERRVW